METARVDVVYRPLRLGFALISTDRASFRKVVRVCNPFWGGRYNPILAVDRPEAVQLVEVFRPDFLVPVGDDPAVASFVANFPHLKNPLFPEELFFPASHGREGQAQLLDIQNLIVHWRESADWKRLVDDGFRLPRWAPDDPLADAFLAQFGGFPDPAEIGLDYGQIVSQITTAVEIPIASDGALPHEILDLPGISHLSRFGLEPQNEVSEQAREAAGEGGFSICRLGEGSRNGLNIRPQRTHFGQESSLGVLGGSPARPRVRFALKRQALLGRRLVPSAASRRLDFVDRGTQRRCGLHVCAAVHSGTQ